MTVPAKGMCNKLLVWNVPYTRITIPSFKCETSSTDISAQIGISERDDGFCKHMSTFFSKNMLVRVELKLELVGWIDCINKYTLRNFILLFMYRTSGYN